MIFFLYCVVRMFVGHASHAGKSPNPDSQIKQTSVFVSNQIPKENTSNKQWNSIVIKHSNKFDTLQLEELKPLNDLEEQAHFLQSPTPTFQHLSPPDHSPL